MKMASQDAYEKVEYINLYHLNYVVALIIISLALLVNFTQVLLSIYHYPLRTLAPPTGNKEKYGWPARLGGATLNIICGAGAGGTCSFATFLFRSADRNAV